MKMARRRGQTPRALNRSLAKEQFDEYYYHTSDKLATSLAGWHRADAEHERSAGPEASARRRRCQVDSRRYDFTPALAMRVALPDRRGLCDLFCGLARRRP